MHRILPFTDHSQVFKFPCQLERFLRSILNLQVVVDIRECLKAKTFIMFVPSVAVGKANVTRVSRRHGRHCKGAAVPARGQPTTSGR